MGAPPVSFCESRRPMFRPTPARSKHGGFTTVELIVTISIAGILAAFAVARFSGRDTFASRGFYDEATSVVRYAQKTAIAWRITTVYVCVTSNSISAGTAAGCATPLTHPGTGGALTASAPSGVTLSPVGDFTFNGIGRPSAAQAITVTSTIAGDPARQIVVEAETGYVHH
jgi:MSHA pilin protein MshC